MGLIQKLLGKSSENKAEFKAKLKQAQQEDKVERLITERAKSANQREVERYVKEGEEAEYKKILDEIRHKNNSEMWGSKGKNILNSQKNILKNDRPILKEKNIFLDKKNNIPFVQGGGMFFK